MQRGFLSTFWQFLLLMMLFLNVALDIERVFHGCFTSRSMIVSASVSLWDSVIKIINMLLNTTRPVGGLIACRHKGGVITKFDSR